MIELFVLIAAQAAPMIRIPPVAAPIARPVVTAPVPMAEPGAIMANILPDLVVSEVRVEDDTTAWFKVTNQGTADAVGRIRVFTGANIASRVGQPAYPDGFDNLAMGESHWVRIAGYSVRGDSGYTGTDTSFALTKATAISAEVDPPINTSVGWFGTSTGMSPEDMMNKSKSTCSQKIGCIRELNEDNNSFRVEASGIGHGKPE